MNHSNGFGFPRGGRGGRGGFRRGDGYNRRGGPPGDRGNRRGGRGGFGGQRGGREGGFKQQQVKLILENFHNNLKKKDVGFDTKPHVSIACSRRSDSRAQKSVGSELNCTPGKRDGGQQGGWSTI